MITMITITLGVPLVIYLFSKISKTDSITYFLHLTIQFVDVGDINLFLKLKSQTVDMKIIWNDIYQS